MTITYYPCGCLTFGNHLAPAPPVQCLHHRTEPDACELQAYGFIGLDRRQARYVWTPILLPWVEIAGQIIGNKVHGPELGTVDGGTLRPAGARRQIIL